MLVNLTPLGKSVLTFQEGNVYMMRKNRNLYIYTDKGDLINLSSGYSLLSTEKIEANFEDITDKVELVYRKNNT